MHAHTYRTIPSHHLEASLASAVSVSLERARIVSVGLGGAILARRATHQGALVHTPAVGVLICSLFRPKDRYTVSSLFLNAYLEASIFVNDYSENWQGRKMDRSRERTAWKVVGAVLSWLLARTSSLSRNVQIGAVQVYSAMTAA